MYGNLGTKDSCVRYLFEDSSFYWSHFDVVMVYGAFFLFFLLYSPFFSVFEKEKLVHRCKKRKGDHRGLSGTWYEVGVYKLHDVSQVHDQGLGLPC